MPPLLSYLIKRTLLALITLLVITTALYGTVMLTPAEARATLYLPPNLPSRMTAEQYQNLIDQIIKRNHLYAPYPAQYFYWLTNLVQANWGYSPTLGEDVLPAILRRTPATVVLFGVGGICWRRA